MDPNFQYLQTFFKKTPQTLRKRFVCAIHLFPTHHSSTYHPPHLLFTIYQFSKHISTPIFNIYRFSWNATPHTRRRWLLCEIHLHPIHYASTCHQPHHLSTIYQFSKYIPSFQIFFVFPNTALHIFLGCFFNLHLFPRRHLFPFFLLFHFHSTKSPYDFFQMPIFISVPSCEASFDVLVVWPFPFISVNFISITAQHVILFITP